jgi:hypothetical protein
MLIWVNLGALYMVYLCNFNVWGGAVFIFCFYYMIPATNDLVCEWPKVKWCTTLVPNSVFQIKKKSEEFNSEARGNPAL